VASSTTRLLRTPPASTPPTSTPPASTPPASTPPARDPRSRLIADAKSTAVDIVNVGEINPNSPGGYLVAFFIPLLDAFFPVVPSETVVIGLGVLASKSLDARIVPLVVLVALGAFIGDNISYWLGRRFGTRIADRLLRGEKGRASREWAERMLENYGMRLLIVARFIPGGRTALTITAGIIEYPYGRFRLAVGIAAVVWTAYSFGIGVIGGRTFEDNTWAALGLAFGVAAVIAVLSELVRRIIARRRRRA
jgi:membrane protein DedA with SNARE-associated domain